MPMSVPVVSVRDAEPFRRTRFSPHRFNLAVARGRIRDQRLKQMMRGMRDLIDRAIECFFVCLGRFCKSAQLSHELERRRADFIVRRWRTEVMKCFDGSAHEESLTADSAEQHGFLSTR
jgi:hypothetical protein